MTQNDSPAIARRILRKGHDGRWVASLWLVDGPHIHGKGRTKTDALEAAERILAAYVGQRTLDQAILDRGGN